MYTLIAHPRVFQAGGGKGLVKRCYRVAGKFLPDMTANDLTAKAKGGGYGCGLLVLVCAYVLRAAAREGIIFTLYSMRGNRRQGRGDGLLGFIWAMH